MKVIIVNQPLESWAGGRHSHLLPSKHHWKNYEDHDFLKCFPNNRALTAQAEAWGGRIGPRPGHVDHQLPHEQITDHEAAKLYAWCGCLQPSRGTVLAANLFNLYTSNLRQKPHTCHTQKFLDDTLIIGHVSEGTGIQGFHQEPYWLKLSILHIQTTKSFHLQSGWASHKCSTAENVTLPAKLELSSQ